MTTLFRRTEVWVLLALTAGTMVLVFKPFGSQETGTITHVAPLTGQEDGIALVHRMTLQRDFGNARLDIDLRLTNKHAKKVQMVAPAMKLMAGKDRQVPEFFLPVEPPPELPPKAIADVKLRYWLEKADLNGKLTLIYEGQPIEIKSERPFDLGNLKNAEPKVMKPGEW